VTAPADWSAAHDVDLGEPAATHWLSLSRRTGTIGPVHRKKIYFIFLHYFFTACHPPDLAVAGTRRCELASEWI
jgi:hypothetical protein